MRRSLLATLLAMVATLAGAALVGFGGPAVATLELGARDVVTPSLAPVSPALVIVSRDARSEARLGTGAWDRAVLARAVSALARGGAAAIGLDAPARVSAPGRGGATSDALLAQAVASAGNVVVPAPLESAPGLAPPASVAAHTVAPPDADGVVRRVPLVLRHDGREVAALGVALAAVAGQTPVGQVVARIPTAADGTAQPRWAPDLPVTPFGELWEAIERGDGEALRRLAEGKTVLVLTEPAAGRRLTPIGPLADVAIQAEVLNAVLTGAWTRPAPRALSLAGVFVFAVLAAWLGLGSRPFAAVLGVALLVGVCGATLTLTPYLTGVVLPVLPPLVATLVAGAAALVWSQIVAARRLRGLEGEIGTIRSALVRQESTVEALEEDLEAARAAVVRSTGAERELLQAAAALRDQLGEANAQEAHTRARLQELEHELRVAGSRSGGLADADLERLRRQAAEVGIVTRDAAVLSLFRDVQRAARATLPVLLTGEPGTGKELFARAVHRLGTRARGPFVAVNMAAISSELFESELFGHARGSFTGAVGDRKGYFEQADHGTIFLDEVGELRPEQQGKLLRVLQERTFHRVGATRPTTVDVRVVAATNRDLQRGVADGWFREDLYFRLRGLALRLPPLRERPHDVAGLAERFLEAAVASGGRRVVLSNAALGALERHPWPGNIRELEHCLSRAVALSDHEVLKPEDLRLEVAAPPGLESDGDVDVLDALRRHRFDMQATARSLGWDRSTVTQRLKGLGFQALVESDGDRARAAAALAGDASLRNAVELKLGEYHEHLLRFAAGFDSADAAVAACRRRFKNLPERYFQSLEHLVRRHFK